MSLLAARGRHRLPSRSQLAADLAAARADLDAALRYLAETARTTALLQDHLDVAGIELSGLRLDLAAAEAALAKATAVSAPTPIRGIHPDDQPTEPTGTDVRPLWDALGITTTTTAKGAAV